MGKGGKESMKKIIIAIFAILCVPCVTHAYEQVKICAILQCNDGFYAENVRNDNYNRVSYYTKCTKCPGKTLADGGAAKVRTWSVDIIGSPHTGLTLKPIAPNKPLFRSACYISQYDNQTFKDSTGNWQYSGGDCKY